VVWKSVIYVVFSRVGAALCCGSLAVAHLISSHWDQSSQRLKERRCHACISLTLPTVTSGSCALQWITDRRSVYCLPLFAMVVFPGQLVWNSRSVLIDTVLIDIVDKSVWCWIFKAGWVYSVNECLIKLLFLYSIYCIKLTVFIHRTIHVKLTYFPVSFPTQDL